MPYWARLILGIVLTPFCIGAVSAFIRILQATGRAETFWVVFLGGAASWLGIYLLLPKPMRIYVFGHELTHVVWTWLFGGKVKKFKATSKGGHVVITKSNFLIILAPYFFPLYAVLLVLFFMVGNWIGDWTPYVIWFHLLIGAAYAFHVTLTWHALKSQQTDITSQGYFFSAVVIFLGNILVLLLGVPLLAGEHATVAMALRWWMEETGLLMSWLGWIF